MTLTLADRDHPERARLEQTIRAVFLAEYGAHVPVFPDHLVGRICALAATAALLRRERTGRGSLVGAAQIEAVTGMLGELMLKAGLEPGSVKPRGNQSERGAPWSKCKSIVAGSLTGRRDARVRMTAGASGLVHTTILPQRF